MRVLFSTPSPAAYMAPPQLGDEQVNCGPHWPDHQDADGSFRSLATPTGAYDLAAVAAKLPPGQQPDLVVGGDARPLLVGDAFPTVRELGPGSGRGDGPSGRGGDGGRQGL